MNEELLRYLDNHDYEKLYGLKEMFLNKENIDKNYLDVYIYLEKTDFYLEKFTYNVVLSDLLLENGIESIEMIFYTLLSYIGKNDIYGALSYINRSVILNKEYKDYRESDGANYSNLLKENKSIQKALVICLFVESLKGGSIDSEIGLKYYELLDLLYEIGYQSSFIKEMTEIGYILF